jgi:CHAT domain-containing protein
MSTPTRDPQNFYLALLIGLLKVVEESQGDESIVHQFFDYNIIDLNKELLAILPKLVGILLVQEAELTEEYRISVNLYNLAIDLNGFPRGDQAVNLEISIACHDQALLFFTHEQFPSEWAMVQMGRANAYGDRVEGDRRENLEISIKGYESALTVRTFEKSPVQWATTLMNRANAYNNRIVGERRENLEVAIQGYESVLLVRTRKEFPAQWATAQMNLAIAYGRRMKGDRQENLEIAIKGYETILEEYEKESFPLEWAMLQMNRAVAYFERIAGNRRENLETAINSYNIALVQYTETQFPLEWSRVQMNLASAYQIRINGDRRENLERAITGYEAALTIRTRGRSPLEWAMVQMNLASAYQSRIEGDRRENLEVAIAGYKATIDEYTWERFPAEWAMVQMNLATAYRSRIQGDRKVNLEIAIAGYEAALTEHTRKKNPIQWARTQINRSIAYSERIEGDRRENLEIAIKGYEEALKEFTHEGLPLEWARTQMNRSIAYSERIEGDPRENLEIAIKGYEEALKEFTHEGFPLEWARTQANLGKAYSDRVEGDYQENRKQATECYEAALTVRTREQSPLEWAGTQLNLASLYRGENNQIAIDIYRQILTIFTPTTMPINALQASRGLGGIYFEKEEWQNAIEVYETAMKSVETSRSWVINEQTRQQVLKDALSVYENAIQCAINLSNYPLAIQYTERIRSRQLVELMSTANLDFKAATPSDISQYLAEYADINRQIQDLRNHHSYSHEDDMAKLTYDDLDNAAIIELEQRKTEIYLEIRSFDPAIAGQIETFQIDFATIQQLIPNPGTAILVCYTTDYDTYIFIIKQGQDPQIHTCTNQGWQKFQKWLQIEWVIPYQNGVSTWVEMLPRLLHNISNRLELYNLVEQYLSNITELIIVPHLYLHQIPFAALPVGKELFGDKFTIRSIPSCQILEYCQKRESIITKLIGTIEDADDSLIGARYEGDQIAALYSISTTNRLRGSTQATVTNYRQLLDRVNRIHSSHHAISRLDNPLESALILANGETITLSDMLLGKRYPHLDEVFLSACETNLGTTTITDDVATLTTGFLCIGARSVQSTLWEIDDFVTALLCIFYHQKRGEDFSPALSLQIAQRQLRNLTGEEFKNIFYSKMINYFTQYNPAMISDIEDRLEGYCGSDRPFRNPYYWAAFITQGAA